MTELKTLAEHNKQRLEAHKQLQPNGIVCPECGDELQDSNFEILYFPDSLPEVSIYCPKCQYMGCRLA